jgi:rhodanese-related sulfurtransferase
MKTSLTHAELKQLLNTKNKVLLLDVRTKEEYLEKHIPMATHLPIEIIESGSYIPEHGKIIITVCGKGGGRSERAATLLRNTFSNEVYFLEGGTAAWFFYASAE